MESNDNLIMEIIAFSGESKCFTFKALENARNNNFAECEENLKLAKQSLVKANKASFTLLSEEAKNHFPVTLLMVHAFDHLSSAESALENAEQLVTLFKLNH